MTNGYRTQQNNMTNDVITQAKIEENRCFRLIFGALGSLGGPLGGSWSHLVPRVFSEPENRVRWTPCGLPWRTPKSLENHSCCSMLASFFKKSVSQNRSTNKV